LRSWIKFQISYSLIKCGHLCERLLNISWGKSVNLPLISSHKYVVVTLNFFSTHKFLILSL
jgi:hypothetical protein